MTDTRYLVHGVFWDGPRRPRRGGPPRRRHRRSCACRTARAPSRELALDAGTQPRLPARRPGQALPGPPQGARPRGPRPRPLPGTVPRPSRGHQCGRCFVVDDSRLIHDFHRGGRVPPGLRELPDAAALALRGHLRQRRQQSGHRVANLRKWNRLAEQGAVVARYVARADDGRVVRILEDLVTRDAGLPQQVRSAAKAAALPAPRPAADLDALNSRLRGEVRAAAGRRRRRAASTSWTKRGCGPALADARSARRRPGTPTRTTWTPAEHGFRIAGAERRPWRWPGLTAPTLDFVVNLGAAEGPDHRAWGLRLRGPGRPGSAVLGPAPGTCGRCRPGRLDGAERILGHRVQPPTRCSFSAPWG